MNTALGVRNDFLGEMLSEMTLSGAENRQVRWVEVLVEEQLE